MVRDSDNHLRVQSTYRRRAVLGALAAGGVAAAAGSGAAAVTQEDGDAGEEDAGDPESLVAVLRGEGLGVDTAAGGCADLTPTGEGTFTFSMVLEEIEDVTQAHIHTGARGEDGPVLVPLFNLDEPRTTTPDEPIVEVGTVDDADAVQTVLEDPAGHYVNVHTTANPGGEIRGQLREVGRPSEPQDEEAEGTPTPEETPTPGDE